MLMGCIIHLRVPYIGRRVCTHIHSVGFCIAYSDILVFLGPQTADKQEKRSAFFDVRKGIPIWNTHFLYSIFLIPILTTIRQTPENC